MNESILLRLIVMYATLSLASVGGAPSIVPDLHRQVVDVLGWMSDRQFAETFALAQLAPGPNMMVTSLIGWRVAGLAGLLVSTLAIILPSSTLAFVFGRLYHRFAEAEWFPTFKAGLPPVVLGLMAASGFVTATVAVHDVLGGLLAAGAAVFATLSRRNPLWAIAVAALASIVASRLGIV